MANVGDQVLFMYGNQAVPAIVTNPAPVQREGAADGAALTVFLEGEPPFTTRAEQDSGKAPATWHRPE